MGAARRAFSLTQGGPFYRLMARLRLVGRTGGVWGWPVALFAWLPILVGESVRLAFGETLDSTWRDISVHTRLLVSLPVLFVADRLLEPAVRTAVSSLYDGKFCAWAALDPIFERGERMRDAWWPEALLAILSLVGGQLALWGVIGSSGLIHGGSVRPALSFPYVWYVLIALPLVHFVTYRWLWRWVIWSYLLFRIARLPLAGLATHPDHAAGLSVVARPLSGYSGFALAVGAVLAGAWESQILAGTTTVRHQLPELIVFLIVLLAVAIAPLLLFCGHLYRLRRRDLVHYGDFTTDYVRAFHQKWLERRGAGTEALGTPDIQSLADIGNAFTVIVNTRLFVFGLRQVLAVWTAALLPMVPLFVTMMPLEQLLKRIVNTIVSGLPL